MHNIRIYTGNRGRDGIFQDVKYITTFNGFSSALLERMQHLYPEGNGYLWLR